MFRDSLSYHMEYIFGDWASCVCSLYLFRMLFVKRVGLAWVYITEYCEENSFNASIKILQTV